MCPAAALLCGLLVVQPPARGNPFAAKADPPPPRRERREYEVRWADPNALAGVVAKHFQGEAAVLAAPPGTGQVILVAAPDGLVREVLDTLGRLDRRPPAVEVEVTLADVPVRADGAEPAAADLLAEAAKAARVRRFRLTAADGQPATVTTGGSRPFTTGAVDGPPAGQRSVSYQEVGTTVKVTPRVHPDGTVSLELSVQDTQQRPGEAAADPASVDINKLAVRLTVGPGKPVLAQAVRNSGKGGDTVAVVAVAARVAEPGDAPKR